jgi:cytochrome b561
MNEPAPVWPRSVRLLHWVSAALVLLLLALGVCMVQLVGDAAMRFELTQTHKSIGIAVLALTLVRLCVRIGADAPAPGPAPRSLRIAAAATHACLYILLLAMPLSGWLMTTTTPVRVPTWVFGLFELPYPLAPDMTAYRLARSIHAGSAVALASLVVLHVAAALAHAFVRRDRIFARMWRKATAIEEATGT